MYARTRGATAEDARITHLILVRHGQSQYNAEGRYTGWADPGLTVTGRREATLAAEALQRLSLSPDIIVCSDLQRAVASATTMVAALGRHEVLIHMASGLRERELGVLTGRLKLGVGCEHLDHPDSLTEDLADFRRRIKLTFSQTVRPWLDLGQTVLVVSHSHVMRELASLWMARRGELNARPLNGQAWIFSKDEVAEENTEPLVAGRATVAV